MREFLWNNGNVVVTPLFCQCVTFFLFSKGCAYGSRPVLMTFDGDRMDVKV